MTELFSAPIPHGTNSCVWQAQGVQTISAGWVETPDHHALMNDLCGDPQLERARTTFSVRLVSRHSGATLRLNGVPLVVYAKSPKDAIVALMRNRSVDDWVPRIDAVPSQAVAQ